MTLDSRHLTVQFIIKFTVKCTDIDSDGFLDIDVTIVWDNDEGNYCSPDSVSTWPIPGTPSKCWSERVNIPIEIPQNVSC